MNRNTAHLAPSRLCGNFQMRIAFGSETRIIGAGDDLKKMIEYLYHYGVGVVVGNFGPELSRDGKQAAMFVRFTSDMLKGKEKVEESGRKIFNEDAFDKMMKELRRVVKKNDGVALVMVTYNQKS